MDNRSVSTCTDPKAGVPYNYLAPRHSDEDIANVLFADGRVEGRPFLDWVKDVDGLRGGFVSRGFCRFADALNRRRPLKFPETGCPAPSTAPRRTAGYLQRAPA